MESQYLNIDGLALYDALIKEFINNKIFIGTYEQYQTANANNEIPINALVIITDDNNSGSGGSGGSGDSSGDNTSTSTSSKLGEGALDYMILG